MLALAAQRFDALITVDKNLPYQQNRATLAVAVVVLDAVSNELAFLAPLVPSLERELGKLVKLVKGSYICIAADG